MIQIDKQRGDGRQRVWYSYNMIRYGKLLGIEESVHHRSKYCDLIVL